MWKKHKYVHLRNYKSDWIHTIHCHWMVLYSVLDFMLIGHPRWPLPQYAIVLWYIHLGFPINIEHKLCKERSTDHNCYFYSLENGVWSMLVFCHSVIINEHFLSFTALEMTYVVSDLFNSPYMDVPQDNGFNMGPCGKNINMFISETINLIGSILYIVTEWSFTVFLILC
jgi:hypothetical protein